MRGRGQHNVLVRALCEVFPENVRKKAQLAVQAAANADGETEVSFAVKQAVRANYILKFFLDDANCDLSYMAHISIKPLQGILNHGLASDKSVSAALLGMTTGIRNERAEAHAAFANLHLEWRAIFKSKYTTKMKIRIVAAAR